MFIPRRSVGLLLMVGLALAAILPSAGTHVGAAAVRGAPTAETKLFLPFVRGGGGVARTPVILLPGIGGSQLVNDAGEQWPRVQAIFDSPTDDFLLNLRLAPDGVSPFDAADPVYTTTRPVNILRLETVRVGPFSNVSDFYNTTITSFEAAGYQLNQTLFPWPYDWRKDIELNAGLLIQFIDQVRTTTGAARVDLVGHSQGGLVTLVALANPASSGKIRKAVTLGAPVLGATRSMALVQYQFLCFIGDQGSCFLHKPTLQTVLRNFPSAYELMPGAAFDQAVGKVLTLAYDRNTDGVDDGPLAYEQWLAIVAAERNSALADRNRAFHERYDTFVPADATTQVVRVIGSNVATIQSITEDQVCPGNGQPCYFEYTTTTGTGDGTVPLHAADLCNAATGFDRRAGVPNKLFSGVDHGALPTNGGVLDFVKGYLADTVSISPSAACETLPRTAPQRAVELELHGPLAATLADAHGRRFLPAATDAPPALHYTDLGPSQSLYFTDENTFTAELRVTDARALRVRVNSFSDWARQTSATFDLAADDAPVGARLTISFAAGQAPAALRLLVDRDGDGTVDARLAPSTTAQP